MSDVPPAASYVQGGATAYSGGREFMGQFSIGPGWMAFDPATSTRINRAIGVLFPPGELVRVVHTSPTVTLLAIDRLRATKWLVLVDRADPSAGRRALVALQWPRRGKVLPLLGRAGFAVAEVKTDRSGFAKYMAAADGRA